MSVRVLGLAAIVLGLLLWATGHMPYLGPHIAIGFCVVSLVFVMGIVAIAKRAVVAGVIGILLAVVVPIAGFLQLPLHYRPTGPVQVLHFAVALSLIGVAERLYSAIRRLP